MVAVKNLLFVAATVAAAILPRDANTVLTDLKKINTDTGALTSSIKSWDGSLTGALGIQGKANTVGSDTDKANSDAKGVMASSADSKKILSYIQSSLEPSIHTALTTLVSRKADFDKNGVTGVVKSTVSDLKSKADSLSQTLITDASSDEKSAGQTISKKIDSDFTSAINSLG